MHTRPVIDRDLRDTEPAEVREHRDEAMQLSVDAHSLHDLRAIRLEPAVDVVQVDSLLSAADEYTVAITGMVHSSAAIRGDPALAEDYLPIVHLVFANLKSWLLGCHHAASVPNLEITVICY